MKKTIAMLCLLLAVLTCPMQAETTKTLPTLHVDGRWLVDTYGNRVVLHGVMDTPNMYFNGWRWGDPWKNPPTNYDANGAIKCLDYFEKLFAGMEQANCDVFRLHLDPAWTNDPAKQSDGKESGEADISCFSAERLGTFLESLYLKMAEKAMNHGMYVVVRPPGVCPGSLKVGDYYQQYLMTVWDIFSSNAFVKAHAGQISIELANEPVSLKNAQNQEDPKALHDYFQPIVDKIRANGFTGIIWAPGTGWQGNYISYATHPIEGPNIGYAVHDYCGWYGSSDDTPDPDSKIRNFHKQVPVVDFAPVIITEVDWSPKKPGEGHYNEHGDWVESNYGTWATGSTSKWGKAYKAMLDHFGNISMTLSGTGCLFDIDKLLQTGRVEPAFDGLAEACGKACMDWYKTYKEVDNPVADNAGTAHSSVVSGLAVTTAPTEIMVGSGGSLILTATYQDGFTREVTHLARFDIDQPDVVAVSNGQVRGLKEGTAHVTATFADEQGREVQRTFDVRSTYLPLGAAYISTSLFAQGTYSEDTHTFKPGQWGQMGWEYPNGADMSAFRYLVIRLKEPQHCDAHLNIFTANSIWSDNYESPGFGTSTQIVIDLSTARYRTSGELLNTKDVHIISFWTNGTGTLVVDQIYLTNNADYSPTGVTGCVADDDQRPVDVYTLSGRLVRRAVRQVDALQGLPKGIYLVDRKKVLNR